MSFTYLCFQELPGPVLSVLDLLWGSEVLTWLAVAQLAPHLCIFPSCPPLPSPRPPAVLFLLRVFLSCPFGLLLGTGLLECVGGSESLDDTVTSGGKQSWRTELPAFSCCVCRGSQGPPLELRLLCPLGLLSGLLVPLPRSVSCICS